MKELLSLLFSANFNDLFQQPTNNSWVRFFRYCFVGGFAFLIDFGCYTALVLLGVNYLVSGFLAFLISFAFNFTVSRHFIFVSDTENVNTAKELGGVLLVAFLGMIFTEILLWLFCEKLGIDKLVAKIIVSVIVLVWNYIGRAVFVYKKG